jgi:putative transposase
VHLIFTTKYRRKLLDGTMIEQMRGAFLSAAEKLEIDILEMDGEADHVHLLVAYPPKLAVSVLVNNLKSISSRQIRILNTHLRKQSNSGLLWSRLTLLAVLAGPLSKRSRRMWPRRTHQISSLYPCPIGRGFTGQLLRFNLVFNYYRHYHMNLY